MKQSQEQADLATMSSRDLEKELVIAELSAFEEGRALASVLCTLQDSGMNTVAFDHVMVAHSMTKARAAEERATRAKAEKRRRMS